MGRESCPAAASEKTVHASFSCPAPSGSNHKRIQQTVSRDSILPWHSVQFGWLPGPQDQFQLSLRARSNFGMDSYGNPAQIDCQLTAQDR